MVNDDLLGVMKPARYIGGEWNAFTKDIGAAEIKFALGFADVYEVGMSNLGLRILYGLLNSLEGVACERFFAPAADMENMIRQGKNGMCSLESGAVLSSFDILGFSLGYELNYPDVLNIMDLAGIPLRASSRDKNAPLVIAGGPCVLNPEPMADFFDVIIIGEAEEALVELVEVYRRLKKSYSEGGLSREALLFELSRIEGVYVPSFYKVEYSPDGKLTSFSPLSDNVPARIKKRFIKDLDASFFPRQWVVPYIQIVHDRITLEIMRGCPNRCRFCQARTQYFPLRYRSPDKVSELAFDIYKRTGYQEISLGGLSVSDYPGIKEMASGLQAEFKNKCVSLSLPSIKPKSFLGDLSNLIATIRKTGLTLAPEVGTARMREIVGKDFDMDVFMEAVAKAYAAGYQHVKLYFMLGIPYESREDLDGIFSIAQEVSELRRKVSGRPAEVHLSINTLIPKPHTPLQWFAMEPCESIREKQAHLKQKIRVNRRLKAGFHNLELSMLEGMLSRGDRRLSGVIEEVFRLGARFDNWEDGSFYRKWMEAFLKSGISFQDYLNARTPEDILPWDFIDTGVPRQILEEEFKKVVALE